MILHPAPPFGSLLLPLVPPLSLLLLHPAPPPRPTLPRTHPLWLAKFSSLLLPPLQRSRSSPPGSLLRPPAPPPAHCTIVTPGRSPLSSEVSFLGIFLVEACVTNALHVPPKTAENPGTAECQKRSKRSKTAGEYVSHPPTMGNTRE